MIKKFRPYQKKIYDMTFRALEDGRKRIAIQVAGGSGKTFMFTRLLEDYTKKYNKKSIFLTPRINLSKQTYKPEFGYYQGSKSISLESNVIIGNIQTFLNRPLSSVDVILFDECHMIDNMAKRIIEKFPDKTYIAISATLYKGDASPLEAFKDFYMINHGVTEEYLIKSGYLTKMKYYRATTDIDEDELQVSEATKDFTDETLRALERKGVFNDIWESVKDNLKRENLREEGMLVVTHSQRQARIIYDDFVNKGFKTGLIISNNKYSTKELTSFSRRELEVIVAVDKVSTGTDIPHLTNIVLARPYANHASYRQVVYRGDRLSKGKEFFRVFDLAGNWDRLGNPFVHPELKSKDEVRRKKQKCERCKHDKFDRDSFDDLTEGVRVTITTCKSCKNEKITTKKLDGISCDSCGLIMPLSYGEVAKEGFIFKCECGYKKVVKRSIKKFELVTNSREDIIKIISNNLLPKIKDRDIARNVEAFFYMATDKQINFAYNVLSESSVSKDSKSKVIDRASKAGKKLIDKTSIIMYHHAIREGLEDRVIEFVNSNEKEKTKLFTVKYLSMTKTKRRITRLLNEFSK